MKNLLDQAYAVLSEEPGVANLLEKLKLAIKHVVEENEVAVIMTFDCTADALIGKNALTSALYNVGILNAEKSEDRVLELHNGSCIRILVESMTN